MPDLAWIDWIFVAVLVASCVVGMWRGLVDEIISLLSWLVAFVLAQWFAPNVAAWLPMHGATEMMRYALGFVLVFVVTLVAGTVLSVVVSKLVGVAGLGLFNRLLGVAFGLVRGILVLLTATILIAMTPMRTAPWWAQGLGPQAAQFVLVGLKPILPQEFGKYLP